jgi:hypothetical protein
VFAAALDVLYRRLDRVATTDNERSSDPPDPDDLALAVSP